MMLHPAVEAVLSSGRVSTADGRVVRAHSYMHVPRDECELLYRQVAATRATQAIEVGMALGISTRVCATHYVETHRSKRGNVRISSSWTPFSTATSGKALGSANTVRGFRRRGAVP